MILKLRNEVVILLLIEIDWIVSMAWDYGDHHSDVKNWPGICQFGKHQSPINIATDEVEKRNELSDPFVFEGYDKRMFGEMSVLKNTGHTIKFGFSTNEHASNITPSISGGWLGQIKYYFLNAHLHWGATNDQGSEHTFDEERSPMEMHLVHWNSGLGGNPGEAIETGSHDALAVLSIHFKIGEKNENLDSFFTNVDRVIKQGAKAALSEGVKLGQFLPQNSDNFYRYNGSLTTPGCEEIVVWTIFKEKIEISQHQMGVLRQITHKHYDKDEIEDLSNNFRPAQDLNGRIVLEFGDSELIKEDESPSVVIAGWGSGYRKNSAVVSQASIHILESLLFLSFVYAFCRVPSI